MRFVSFAHPSRCLAVLLLAAGAARVEAQLAAHSPFLPPQGSMPTAPAPTAPLEFRGFIDTGEGVQYRIHDPAKKAGTWAKANERETNFGVTVKQYDAERKVLTVEHEGRTLTLPEREAKVVSSGSAAQVMPPPMPMPMPAPNVNPAVTQSVVVNPTPADEQRRLEAVAAEVARRRALREQASQQMNNQGQPTNANSGVTVPGIPRPMPPVQR